MGIWQIGHEMRKSLMVMNIDIEWWCIAFVADKQDKHILAKFITGRKMLAKLGATV